ncbi:MAG: PAS domain S-box protein [Candidatus Eisenbacteria bacterium]|nr:PAS domain S-box protein [Candidatus Eisenbacteria bacterium]
MAEANRETLRELLRRVDEVRGLSDRSASSATVGLADTDVLVRTLGELVEELERSHRRLIETNVQLVSLREVAGSLTTTQDTAETTRTVTRYLQRAFGFDQVCLLLIDRERGVLTGAWTGGGGALGGDDTVSLEIPLVGDRGSLSRAIWLNRTLLHHDCRRHPPAFVGAAHPLHDVFARIGSMATVPLQRSQSDGGGAACERCMLGDATMLAPPAGPAAATWAHDREETQRRCLSCDRLPSLGIIGAARTSNAPPLTAADVTLVESIALSVAPMVENARLFQDLRKSQRFQEHVLDSMASALVAFSLHGEVLSFNRAAEDLLGWKEADALDRSVGEVFGAQGEALLAGTLERGLDVHRQETSLITRDGAALPVRMTTSALRDDHGTVYGSIATFLDLTPIKRAEEHARQLDRLAALGRFTSSVAHEIRNPLTGIAMGVQHLARVVDGDEKQKKNVDFVLGEIKRLDRIVQELFDVTHPRRLDLQPRPLETTLRRAEQSLEGLLARKEIRVVYELAAGLPDVPHDGDQMQQVFINLVKNAAEASPDGATIRVRAEAGAAHGRGRKRVASHTVVASVTDDGPGIDEATCRTLFEPFFTTKPGGTGLGLYITHDIVKRHGGHLTVQSEPGKGATFRVELPLESHGGKS